MAKKNDIYKSGSGGYPSAEGKVKNGNSAKNVKPAKKVILFIVEGITDKASLGLVMTRLITNESVRFEITNGDIMVMNSVSISNAAAKVGNYVTKFLAKSHYLRSDIMKIVHIIDTDGAFIPESCVKKSKNKGTWYFQDCIETSYPEDTVSRIQNKREIANYLFSRDSILGIPYRMYYFSRNIEHVFHGIERTISSKYKISLAREFEDKFADNPEDFIKFINSESFSVWGSYDETWEYIMNGTHSLKRKSNLRLFFDEK